MILVEQHIITSQHSEYKKIDHLCFLSKNLYNTTLYTIKKHYEETGKILKYKDIQKEFSSTNQKDYRALPANSSQQIIRLVDQNIKSYFALLRKWKKNPKSLKGCPQFPKYKDKLKGRNIFIHSQITINKKKNVVPYPKALGLKPIQTKIPKNLIKQVRIIPQTSCYVIEVVYEKQENLFIQNDNIASIDLGVNSLAALTFNNNEKTYLFNGKPLKSINQYWHKKKALLTSKLPHYLDKNGKKQQRKSSNKLRSLNFKHKNKINDYLHKSSKNLVNKLKENNISKLVIGYNQEWKQGVNLGNKTNQSFVSIPYKKFIEKVQYKCQLSGINIVLQEESYTSKCSSLDKELIQFSEQYLGKRVQRGLFRTKDKIYINSDINGSLNIGRKVAGDNYVTKYLTSRGYGQYPIKVNS